jgi:osmotically-inducible protein OsmY
MKTLLSTTCLLVGIALAPAGAYAQSSTMGKDRPLDRTAQKESPKEAIKDSIITAKIKAEMAKDKEVSATSIKVDTDANGVVQLSGTAKSRAEAEKAVSIAQNVQGVTSVKNDIKVQAK